MKTVLLNKDEHADLKVIRKRSALYGDDVMYTPTFPQEFRSIQAYYPILFRKDHQGDKFQPIALFGFEAQENLFLTENGWSAGYVPVMIERQPFSIGIQRHRGEDGSEHQRVLHIDLDSPRVSLNEGEPLFVEYGANSPYLERTAAMLETIHHWNSDAQQFTEMLAGLSLLESVTMDITLDNGNKGQLLGFYAINEDKLNSLDADVMMRLHEKRYLEAIYMALASLSNMRTLVELKSKREAGTNDVLA